MLTRVRYPAVCVSGLALGLLLSFSISIDAGFVGVRLRGAPPASARRTSSLTVIERQWQGAPPITPQIAVLLAAGRLMEAQDAYLEILVASPGDLRAMGGLVALRKRLSLGDPDVLRRQAEAYGQAAATGVAISDEHYTKGAMAILAEASLRAAQEIDERRGEKADQTSSP